MRIDAQVCLNWNELLSRFADCQLLLEGAHSQLIALAHSIPVAWDQTVSGLPFGWEAVLHQGVHEHHPAANTLSALAVIVHPDYQGQGLSQQMLGAMKQLAKKRAFTTLIAPVRPILKHQYPLIPMEAYVQWQRSNGTCFDPWIKVHATLGAKLLAIAPHSMVIRASVAQWQEWTDLIFPGSGEFLVPGALHPITIDCDQQIGVYEEANLWMCHAVV